MTSHASAETVWLNGRLLPAQEARIGIYDRGFLFGDGIYELVRFFDGIGVGMDLHTARLAASLDHVRIRGFDAESLPSICHAVLAANGLVDASVYVQVTRGAADHRSHVPPHGLQPTVLAVATAAPPLSALRSPDAVRAILLPDERWLRCEIKTISLMGNVLAAMTAAERGADEAILHRDGVLSEGSSTNVFLWNGTALVTPSIDDAPPILHGVSRAQLIDAALTEGLRVEERRVLVSELRSAEEIMITSSRRLLSSVVRLDDKPVGAERDRAGAMARRLHELLRPRLHSPS